VATDYPLDLVGFSFAILGLDACRADSDCAASEICAGERCVPYGGACVEGECRDGYVCEADACVIAVLACGSDEGCPSTEECDLERRECRPRRPCSDALPCPDDQICRPDLALCFPP